MRDAWRQRGLLGLRVPLAEGEGTSVDLGPGGSWWSSAPTGVTHAWWRRRTTASIAPGPGVLMLLAVDVGNTNVKLGVYDDRHLVASWRLTTRREQTADEYGVFTHTMLRSHGLEPRQMTDVAISSTVPAVQRTMEDMAGRYFELTPFVVDPRRQRRARHARRLSSRGGPRSSRQGRGGRGAVRAAADHHRLRHRDDLRVRLARRGSSSAARSRRGSRRRPRRSPPGRPGSSAST